jgi:molybdate transport system regulatory protein
MARCVGIASRTFHQQPLGGKTMFTSARNQLCGKVTAIQRGAVNDEVEISLPDGQKVVAVLTHSSTESLGLKPGTEAFALIKASWIILLTNTAGIRLSARNQLSGTVEEVTLGAVNAEVTLKLASGDIIAAIVTNESVRNLGLAPGVAASAAFKASSVIVGVKA